MASQPDIYDARATPNPLYRDVWAPYGAVALPCRINAPHRKGKVEAGVAMRRRRRSKDNVSSVLKKHKERDDFEMEIVVSNTKKKKGLPVREHKTACYSLPAQQQPLCLVTKDKLLREVWPDTFVEEANLSVNIASLRRTLDKSVGKRQYIETVTKSGYRFVASVSEPSDKSAGTVSPRISEESLVIGGENGSERDQVLNSLAVLSFDNESCDSDAEYLCTGLTESIINGLSQFHDLRVIARNTVSRYQGKDIEPRTLGHQLGVRAVLTGRILRLRDRLIIRTELVDVINGWQLWGDQYHTKVSDILVVQEEMAKEISERLRIKLSGG